MFSQTVEYALRAAVWLASHPGHPQTTQQIAANTKVPAGYLSKVMQALGRASLVNAQRGLNGGFTLMRRPGQIRLIEVINAVDAIRRIDHCPLGLEAHGARLCPLHQRLDDAIGHIERAFTESTLADLLTGSSSTHPFGEEAKTRGRIPK